MKYFQPHHAIIAYILVAIITYGHAFSKLDPPSNPVQKPVDAFVLSVMWPIYWSVIAWETP